MLTTAQQKVKQELEELKLNALANNNDDTVIPRKKPFIFRWIFTIILILLLIGACSLLLKSPWI